jgi:hypothetical protein
METMTALVAALFAAGTTDARLVLIGTPVDGLTGGLVVGGYAAVALVAAFVARHLARGIDAVVRRLDPIDL